MEIERKDRNPTPFLGLPKKRVIRGLPKTPDPVAALKSLVPGFPENVDVPEFLWGRSSAKRVPPHMFFGHFEGSTEKAWRMRYNGKLYWLPKSQVYVVANGIDEIWNFNNYEVWIPHWLAKKNGMLEPTVPRPWAQLGEEPEVTITITPEQQEGIDRLRTVGEMRLIAPPESEHWRCTHCQAVNHHSRYVCWECHRAPTPLTCEGCSARREIEVQEYPDQIWCSLWQIFRHDERCDEYIPPGQLG